MKLSNTAQVELAGQGVVPIKLAAVPEKTNERASIVIQETMHEDAVGVDYEEDLVSLDVSPMIRKARFNHQNSNKKNYMVIEQHETSISIDAEVKMLTKGLNPF